MFEGFTVAMSGDLSALAISAGIDVAAVDNFSHNAAPTTFLMQLVGISFNSNNVQSYGLHDEIGMVGSVVFRNLGMLSVSSFSGPNGQAGLHFGMPGDLALPSNTGVWLFRAIPEATGQSLAIVALAAFVLSRPVRRAFMPDTPLVRSF